MNYIKQILKNIIKNHNKMKNFLKNGIFEKDKDITEFDQLFKLILKNFI